MSPLEFMQRLAARATEGRPMGTRAAAATAPDRFGVRRTSLREVSGPRCANHGVLAPNAKLRALVVRQELEAQEQATEVAVADECEVETAQARPPPTGRARGAGPDFAV